MCKLPTTTTDNQFHHLADLAYFDAINALLARGVSLRDLPTVAEFTADDLAWFRAPLKAVR